MIERFTVVESPYSGDVERHRKYLAAAFDDCRKRGEIPVASHAMYAFSGLMDDADQQQRALGIDWGLRLLRSLTRDPDAVVVQAFYVDEGWSQGMNDAWGWSNGHCSARQVRTVKGWGTP